MARTARKFFVALVGAAVLCTACGSGSAQQVGSAPAIVAPASPASTTVPAGPTATPQAAPVLGRPGAPGQVGYGTARPQKISNDGDPTGTVTDVAWTSWGAAKAEGDGTSAYVGPGRFTADATEEKAHVVAFNLGICGGTLMYQAVEWYFPQHGQKFDPASYHDICTGGFVGER